MHAVLLNVIIVMRPNRHLLEYWESFKQFCIFWSKIDADVIVRCYLHIVDGLKGIYRMAKLK